MARIYGEFLLYRVHQVNPVHRVVLVMMDEM